MKLCPRCETSHLLNNTDRHGNYNHCLTCGYHENIWFFPDSGGFRTPFEYSTLTADTKLHLPNDKYIEGVLHL